MDSWKSLLKRVQTHNTPRVCAMGQPVGAWVLGENGRPAGRPFGQECGDEVGNSQRTCNAEFHPDGQRLRRRGRKNNRIGTWRSVRVIGLQNLDVGRVILIAAAGRAPVTAMMRTTRVAGIMLGGARMMRIKIA